MKDKKEIVYKNISQNTFQVLINWIYTGSCVIKQDYMMELLEIADQFNINSLKDSTCDYIVKGITKDTVFDMINDARSGKYKFDSKLLIEKLVSFVEDNDMDIFTSKSFLKFDEDLLSRFIQSDKIQIDEIEIFNVVLKWVNFIFTNKKGKQNKQPNMTLEQTISKLIQHVRFPLMTPDQLMDIVKPSGVVSDDLYLKGMEWNIVSDGPFDKTDKSYQPRGQEKRIFFQVHPDLRLNFTTSGGQQTIEKIKGGNSWESGIAFCNKPITKGKTYWEVTILSLNSDRTGLRVGITKNNTPSGFNQDIVIGMSGIRHNCYNSEGGSGQRCGVGDKIGVLVDFTKNQVLFFRNGYYINTYATVYSSTTYYPVVHMFYQKDKVTIQQLEAPPKGY